MLFSFRLGHEIRQGGWVYEQRNLLVIEQQHRTELEKEPRKDEIQQWGGMTPVFLYFQKFGHVNDS